MKIIFWGTPKYAAENLLSLIKSENEVIAVVTQPDRKRGRGNILSPSPVKQIAIDFGIPFYTTHSISKDVITKQLILNLKADLYIVVAFGQILPKDILDQPKFGCWNSHASLLPAWRGAAPIQWSIINNDSKTGVCIMAMEEGLDTGPVINQESLEINDSDNLEILTDKLSTISSKLLIKSIEQIKKTQDLDGYNRLIKLKAISQSEISGTPSYARQIKKADFRIDWYQNARNIFKKIQGLYPNTYTVYNCKRIKIIDASLTFSKKNSQFNHLFNNTKKNFKPGEIINISKEDGIIVMTIDYPICVKFGQLEGKKRTNGYVLSKQSDLKVNEILES